MPDAPHPAPARSTADHDREPWPAPYRIETPRLLLRCFDPRDAPGTKLVMDRHRGDLAGWLDLPDEPEPVEVMAARLLQFRASFDTGERFHYAAFIANRAEPAGTISVEPIRGRGLLASGWIDPGIAHDGLASEALAAICQLAFDLGGAHYVELRIRPDNARSRLLAERLGFTHEATLAGREWSGGVAHDEMIWTLFRTARERSITLPGLRAFDAIGRAMA